MVPPSQVDLLRPSWNVCVCASLISAWLREGERKGSDIFTLFLRYLSRKLLLKDSKKNGQLTRSSHCPCVGFLSIRGNASREEGPPLAGDKAPIETTRVRVRSSSIGCL